MIKVSSHLSIISLMRYVAISRAEKNIVTRKSNACKAVTPLQGHALLCAALPRKAEQKGSNLSEEVKDRNRSRTGSSDARAARTAELCLIEIVPPSRRPSQITQSGIAFFRALAKNAASSGKASSAKDCGGWTAYGSRSRVDGDSGGG